MTQKPSIFPSTIKSIWQHYADLITERRSSWLRNHVLMHMILKSNKKNAKMSCFFYVLKKSFLWFAQLVIDTWFRCAIRGTQKANCCINKTADIGQRPLRLHWKKTQSKQIIHIINFVIHSWLSCLYLFQLNYLPVTFQIPWCIRKIYAYKVKGLLHQNPCCHSLQIV